MPQLVAPLSAKHRSPLALAGWLVTIVAAATLAIPCLVQPGMFFDGVMYATVSRNLAVGIGDVWHPVYCAGWGGDFREAPPLAFVLESYCFRLFGDHFWVEKLYSALTGVGTALLMLAIWRQLVGRRRSLRSLTWLPVLIWICLPLWMSIYGNNLLEGTVGLFAIAAVYASLRASTGGHAPFVWLPAAAVCVVAALMSKGPVGLFPLATPAIIALTLGWNQRKPCATTQSMPRRLWRNLVSALLPSVALVALTAAFLTLVLAQPGAYESFCKYLHDQVFASLAGRREASSSALGRFYIIYEIGRELALPLAVAAAVVIWARMRRDRNDKPDESEKSTRRATLFCLLTGLSASLPIMLSLKQFNWYIFPSCPFYCLAIALWCGPAMAEFVSERSAGAARFWTWRIAGVAVGCSAALVICACAKAYRYPPRELGIYHDVVELGRVASKSSSVTCVGFSWQDIHNDGAMPPYLARCAYISADAKPGHEYLLAPVGSTALIPAGYTDIPSGMQRYRLFRRTDDAPKPTAPLADQPPRPLNVAPDAMPLVK